jgi:lysophospholipase L1-like esterase
MLKRIFSNLMLFCVSISVTLIIGESAARLFLKYQDKRIQDKNQANVLTQVDKEALFIPVQPGSFANRPNWQVHWWGHDIRTDDLGCRIGPAAPDNARTILFLGDSMIFGLGLPDSSSIPALLQADLNQMRPDNPCKVINTGVIGYDFQQYLYQLKRLAPIVSPALIVVGICHNDLLPNEDPYGNVLLDRPGVDQNALKRSHAVANCNSPMNCVEAFIKNSALYRVWRQSDIKAKLSPRPQGPNQNIKATEFTRAPHLVDEFIQTAQELGVPVAFVYFPEFETLGTPGRIVYLELLEKTGQPVYDLSFSQKLNKDSYFLREYDGHLKPDIHFNLQGSRIVADEISRWLVASNLWKSSGQNLLTQQNFHK